MRSRKHMLCSEFGQRKQKMCSPENGEAYQPRKVKQCKLRAERGRLVPSAESIAVMSSGQ